MEESLLRDLCDGSYLRLWRNPDFGDELMSSIHGSLRVLPHFGQAVTGEAELANIWSKFQVTA